MTVWMRTIDTIAAPTEPSEYPNIAGGKRRVRKDALDDDGWLSHMTQYGSSVYTIRYGNAVSQPRQLCAMGNLSNMICLIKQYLNMLKW